MSLCSMIFVERNWKSDQQRLSRAIDYLVDIGTPCHIVIFPEGTFFYPQAKKSSDEFAKKNGLKPYEYILHPRTTGSTYIINRLSKSGFIKAIYDVTLVYPNHDEGWEIWSPFLKLPQEVHLHVKRIPISEVPNDIDELKIWIHSRWDEKEKLLRRFWTEKSFSDESNRIVTTPVFRMVFIFYAILTGKYSVTKLFLQERH